MKTAQRGFALITVLAIAVVLGIATVAILQTAINFGQLKGDYRSSLQTQYIAEAGMQQALYTCRTTGCASNSSFNMTGTPVDDTCTTKSIDVKNGTGNFTGLKQIEVTVVCGED